MNLELKLIRLYLNDPSEQIVVILTGLSLFVSSHSLQHGQRCCFNIKQGHLHLEVEFNSALLICGCHPILIKSLENTYTRLL